jgi:hypothetical protein
MTWSVLDVEASDELGPDGAWDGARLSPRAVTGVGDRRPVPDVTGRRREEVATIERALVAICQAHKLHGFPSLLDCTLS